MLVATQVAAFLGVGLAAAAYLPQIVHLSREHCAAGISRAAFCTWLVAAVLITSHAIATGAVAFIALGVVQVIATVVVLVYATRYASSYCAGHEPGPPAGDASGSKMLSSDASNDTPVSQDAGGPLPAQGRSDLAVRR